MQSISPWRFPVAVRTALEPATSLVSDDDQDGMIDPGEMPILHGHHPCRAPKLSYQSLATAAAAARKA